MVVWLNEKLWIKGQILAKLPIPKDRLLFVEHHLAHAASAFFASPYAEAAILTVDGVGEWATATLGRGCADWDGTGKNCIELFSEIKYPHSLGLLYSAFTAFLGFAVNDGEYKVMGMAPYGQPNRVDDVYKLIEVSADGSFRLNLDYFSFHYSTTRTFHRRFEQLFGEPRQPEAPFYLPGDAAALATGNITTARRNQVYADIAASVQRVTEDALLKMAVHAHRQTGLPHLCVAGGVALNSAANGRLLRELPFESVWIQPAAGDAGGALGAALYAYHVFLSKPRKFVQEHSYWGQGYAAHEIRQAIQQGGFTFVQVEDEEKLATLMVEDLLARRVIGLFQGRFEWGPRALGNRSILADPRRAEMKEIVNTKIKFREPFRPFAPVILEEQANEICAGLTAPQRHYPLRYMLMVWPIREDRQGLIPAVTHVDGTGRIQTIRRMWNPLYYRVVEQFAAATGVPVLLNTSFNLRGEPIVNTPANALSTFARSGLDRLYMDQFVIEKANL
jgi:carbamoyltransferase